MLTGSRGDIVKIGDFGLSKNIQEYALMSINFNSNKLYFNSSIELLKLSISIIEMYYNYDTLSFDYFDLNQCNLYSILHKFDFFFIL